MSSVAVLYQVAPLPIILLKLEGYLSYFKHF